VSDGEPFAGKGKRRLLAGRLGWHARIRSPHITSRSGIMQQQQQQQ
jgi:hypothetical protein